MKSVSIVSPERNNRNISQQAQHSATLAQHCKKKEFLNSFVSLSSQRNNCNIFMCVCPTEHLAISNNKKIIVRRNRRNRKVPSSQPAESQPAKGPFYPVNSPWHVYVDNFVECE